MVLLKGFICGYAFGIIALLITNRMGGINGMSSVNISKKFDTQEQCVQYKEKYYLVCTTDQVKPVMMIVSK